MECIRIKETLISVVYKLIYLLEEMYYTPRMQTVGAAAIIAVPLATKSTIINANKLKVYLSNEGKTGCNTK